MPTEDDYRAVEMMILRARNNELNEALRQSVALQRHYASLLNHWDGGERILFDSAEQWLERLRTQLIHKEGQRET